MSKEKEMAKAIAEHFGGTKNIAAVANCMTRLRLTPVDASKINMAAIKGLAGVMGVVEAGDQIQIILGPGFVTKVADEMTELTGRDIKVVSSDIQTKFADIKSKQSPVKTALKKLANIFVPLIPAIIACGMIKGILNAAARSNLIEVNTATYQILDVTGSAIFGFLAILVGINSAKEFHVTESMGAVAGVLTMLPAIAKIQLYGEFLVPGRGGLLGVILIVFFMSYVEKFVRKFIHDTLDLIITPTITLIITAFATYFVFQPVAGVVSDAILSAFMWLLNSGSWWAGALMSMLFLPTVVTGLHHGLIPIHAELINKIGENGLWPILGMAGAGQVGAVLAVLVKTKNANLKKICWGALPVGLMGIGEPAIFGVTLPLGRPFITACIGAAFAGAWCSWTDVATIAFGVSGLPAVLICKPGTITNYLIALLIAYVGGFIFTMLAGFEDPVEEKDPMA